LTKEKLIRSIAPIEGWLKDEEAWILHNLALKSGGDAVIVELGSWKGRSSAVFGLACRGTDRKVYCVDTFKGSASRINTTHREAAERPEGVYPDFRENMNSLGLLDGTVIPVREDHRTACGWFDEKIDLLFIDADHTMEGVSGAYYGWKDKLKPGGVIVFHDYIREYPETVEFVNSLRGEMIVMGFNNMAYAFSRDVPRFSSSLYLFVQWKYKRLRLSGKLKANKKKFKNSFKKLIGFAR
jgi:predicted O-methyltransferase YrrM